MERKRGRKHITRRSEDWKFQGVATDMKTWQEEQCEMREAEIRAVLIHNHIKKSELEPQPMRWETTRRFKQRITRSLKNLF